ncbi:MAG TPA: hypothetical protein VMW83_12235 [Spirochaetia bacterium]|nr:hypothetical protein [Spirochaetia bacterium]
MMKGGKYVRKCLQVRGLFVRMDYRKSSCNVWPKGGFAMTWEDAKRILPNQWLIIEPIQAHTEGNKTILDDITVVDAFQEENSKNALLQYVKLHRKHRERELLVVHTSRPELDIIDKGWIAVRPAL